MNSIVDLFQIIFIFISSRFLTSWQQRLYVGSRWTNKIELSKVGGFIFPLILL